MITERTQELMKKDSAYLFHIIGTVGQASEIIWERGKNAQLWDTEGRQYTDISSGGFHCTPLGFARKELNDAAYKQMQKISHISFAHPYSNVSAIEYAAELAKVLPDDINHVFLSNTGTEANEAAIQLVRTYWHARVQGGKYKLISLAGGYHGSSALTRSLGGFRKMAGFTWGYPGVVCIPNYHCYRCPFGLKYPDCGIRCAHFLETVIEQEREESIASFIAEPVLGAYGVVWPPAEYWPIVRRILSDHNIPLVMDCVQTGFCRTGKFWGVDNWNIVPDIMTMGKGINSSYLPLGAVGVSDKVYNEILGEPSPGGGTSDANPVAAATGSAALKIYTEEKLAERSAKLGEHIHNRLVEEFLPLPCVDDVMGRGLYQSFEIALNKTTGSKFDLEAVMKVRDSINRQCLEKGILNSSDDGYPRRQPIVPPLTIGEDELDAALDVLLDIMKGVKPV